MSGRMPGVIAGLTLLAGMGAGLAKGEEPETKPAGSPTIIRLEATKTTYRLKNGITVVCEHNDAYKGIARVISAYRCGALDEPANMPGAASAIAWALEDPGKEAAPGDWGYQTTAIVGTNGTEYTVRLNLGVTLRDVVWMDAKRMEWAGAGGISAKPLFTLPEEYAKRGLGRANVSNQAVEAEAYSLCNFAWRKGQKRVRFEWMDAGALDLDQLRSFHRAAYRPSALTLKIVGTFEEEEALRVIGDALGHIAADNGVPATMPAVAEAEREVLLEMPRDFNRTFVMIAFPLSASKRERRIISAWIKGGFYFCGGKLSEREFTSQVAFEPDSDPFFAGVAGAPRMDVEEIKSIMLQGMKGTLDDAYMQSRLAWFQENVNMTWMDQSLWKELLTTPDGPRGKTLTLEELRTVVRRYLDPSRAKIVVIRPGEK